LHKSIAGQLPKNGSRAAKVDYFPAAINTKGQVFAKGQVWLAC
jgi:hypothetical protein